MYALDKGSAGAVEAGARGFWEAADVSDRILCVQAPPAQSMSELLTGGDEGAFDLVLVHADALAGEYYELGLSLLKAGGILALGKALCSGKAPLPPQGDAEALAMHQLNEKIRGDARVAAVMLGIADGLYLCRKL